MRLRRRNLHLVVFSFLGLITVRTAHAENPIGAYGLFTQGSGRVMSMGGTYAALSDDASAGVFNPAVAGLSKWTFDLGIATDRITNNETYGSGSGSQTSGEASIGTQPYSYFAYAAAARVGPVVLGIGYSKPYEYSYDQGAAFGGAGMRFDAQITSFDPLVAVRLTDEISLGVSGHLMTLTNQYVGAGTPTVAVETHSDASSYSVGAAYRNKKGGVGAVYSSGAKFSVDTSKNAATVTYSFFRDVVTPVVVTIGGFYRLNDRFLLAADLDRYDIPTNAVDVTSGFSPPVNGADVALNTGIQQVPHGGFEWVLATDKSLDLIFRGGAYQEPARIKQGASRTHTTFGLQVRFGPAMLSVSFDQASGFNSTSQGFSVIVGAI